MSEGEMKLMKFLWQIYDVNEDEDTSSVDCNIKGNGTELVLANNYSRTSQYFTYLESIPRKDFDKIITTFAGLENDLLYQHMTLAES